MTRILFQSKATPEFRFMSNYHVAPFTVRGKTYQSVEHFYQAMKTLDHDVREQIRLAKTPNEARKLGQKVEVRDDWNEETRLRIMEQGVLMKFFQHPDLKELLLATEDAELVEYAPWGDRFWGVDKEMLGENNLGKILMRVRKVFRK